VTAAERMAAQSLSGQGGLEVAKADHAQGLSEPTFRPLNWHSGYLERKNEDRRNFLAQNFQ
jgi:hypothetical protein